MECENIGWFEEPRFQNEDVCRLKACILVEGVVGAGAPEGRPQQCAWRRGPLWGRVIGACVIADGREREIAVVERLTEGGGRGIVVGVAEVFFVELREEAHVVDGRDAGSRVARRGRAEVLVGGGVRQSGR